MSLLSFPSFLLPKSTLSPPKPLRRRRRFLLCSSSSAVKMSAPERLESSAARNTGAAILWYKHDLRIDDHPALVAASEYKILVPLYVFDRRILSRFSDEMLELLLFAVADLRKSLKDQGSNLMIRFGSAESVIQDIIKEVKATTIFAEEEAEYDLRMMMDIVRETLATVHIAEGSPRIVIWSTPFYDIRNLKDLPASHHHFMKLKLPVVAPLLPPKLPELTIDLAWGLIPTLNDLKKCLIDYPVELKDKWAMIKKTSYNNMSEKDQVAAPVNLIESPRISKSETSSQTNSNYKHAQTKRSKTSAFLTQKGNIVGGGTNFVLNALAAYLRYLEGTVRDDWQEVHEKLRNAESREGASFGALFRPALCLGIISRRRVHYEAIKYEKERNAVFLSPFGYSATTVAAAVDTVCSIEWYWLMTLKSQTSDEGMYSIRIWRWNGYLIQYTVAGHDGAAILLVHGFGAFLEHYRNNINSIAESGNRVWAITLLGFGRSEKPNVVYTELMWAELLRDFIIEVVGEPVHLVGNSIGGYFVAIVAGFWPALAKSVVLINSAGNVVPGYCSVPYSRERRTSGAAWLGARLLQLYLRSRIRNIVKNLYPSKMDRVDDWLINEMLRASYDPAVVVVLESIFTFDLSVPLNYLLKGFEEKVLVIQGMKDPLSDSESKLAMLREHCKGITFRELDAGHCPHDELPEEVNTMILEWVSTVDSEVLSVVTK